MPQKFEIGIEPYEVVLGTPRLTLRSESPLDPESARGSLTLANGFRGTVEVSADNRTATLVPDEPLPPGPHTLTITELVTKRGSRISERRDIPFFVVDSRARVRSNLRVESIVRLRAGRLDLERIPMRDSARGRFVDVIKAVDRKTGKPTELAFDERGERVDHRELFTRIEDNRRRTYGKLHPALHARMAEKNRRRLPVAIWAAVDDEPAGEKREKGETKRRPAGETRHRKHIADVVEAVAALAGEHGARKIRAAEAGPVVFAELSAEEIKRLQSSDDVAAIFLHETEGILDLKDSMAIAQSDKVQTNLGFSGKGVNVAVYEDGPDDTTNLSITAQFLAHPSTTQHARHTHGIIKNIEANKPHGHAKDCNLHSANSMDLAAIDWAVQHGCTVISQSFHRDSEQTDSDLSFDDKYKDWVVLHWPYPTILQAAGNGTSSEFVNHKGYNSLTVANHDDTAGALAGDSVFRNPSSAHSDRELPEVAANGTGVSCVGLTLSGTSMAAPAAAGVTALMQQANTTLKSWPEGCRAILLAGASKNITGNTWWVDRNAGVDASDGSGAVDALESVRIAQSRRTRNAAATRRGWDVGTLRSADIGANGETTFSYQVVVPAFLFGARVKVALAWDSLATVIDILWLQFAFDQLKLDLDLKVYDSRGNLVGYSGSWDNSYEIAEFAATPGETYTIKIRRWSGTDDVWYGIAWTVQGTPFIRPDWDLNESVLRASNGRPRRRRSSP
jgi:hypothetical protein